MGFPVALALSLGATTAQAEVTGQQCADSYVKAQTLRQEGDLISAKSELLVCASATCLAAVQKDCAQWLTEVETSLPTVVFEISGAEIGQVHISVDGVTVDTDARAGRAIRVNPGTRKFAFELPDGKTKEVEVAVLEGQKNKTVRVSFAAESKPPGDVPPPGDTEPAQASEANALPWVFVGVGAIGMGLATAFWLDSNSKLSELDDQGCAPGCPQEDRDAIERSRLVGDIGFGVGLVSLGVAAALWLGSSSSGAPEQATSSRRKAPALGFDLRGAPGGGFAGLHGAF